MEAQKEQAMDRIRETLTTNPDTPMKELQQIASEVDQEAESLDLRSFNARYVLGVKRSLKAEGQSQTEKKEKPVRKHGRKARQQKAEAEKAPSGRKAKAAKATTEKTSRVVETKAAKGAKEAKETTEKAASTNGASQAYKQSQGEMYNHARSVLLRFAREMGGAESRQQVIDVMSRIDDFAQDIVQQAR